MSEPIEVDLFVSPHCTGCEGMLDSLAALKSVHGRPLQIRKRDVVEHLDAAVAAGVRATPAFVMDGQLLACGRLTPHRLRKILQNVLQGEVANGTHHR